MSDEDKEYIDVESDDDDLGGSSFGGEPGQADKRAHHNALERKRRDHIKESFNGLRDSIPVIQGEKVSMTKASRAQILKNATDYISSMKMKSNKHKSAIEDLRSENQELEEQIQALEQLVDSNDFSGGSNVDSLVGGAGCNPSLTEEIVETDYKPPRRKKAKSHQQ